MNSARLYRMNEQQAREFFESIRWPNGPVCHHCGSTNCVPIGGKTARPGLKRCRDCRKQFTVTTGTIFHRSKVGLREWLFVIARICESKKGVSAHQLWRELYPDIKQYRTMWFLCHRVREAMRSEPLKGMLSGTVESDESFVGGKPRPKQYKGATSKQGKTSKTPVHVLVERDGRKRTTAITNVTASNLRANVDLYVDRTRSTLMTDEGRSCRNLGDGFAGGHKSVDHSQHEYYRKEDGASTNTAESSFALIKRGVYGTFHHVSDEHLQRYLDEFDFRWDHRKADGVSRTITAIKQAEGKRLMYKQPCRDQ